MILAGTVSLSRFRPQAKEMLAREKSALAEHARAKDLADCTR